MALGGVLTVTVLYLLLRRGMNQIAAATTYRDVSQRLGLIVDTRGICVRGYLDQRRVWVGRVMEGFGPDRKMEVRGVVTLRRPLGMGLLLRPKGLTGRLSSRRSGPERGAGVPAIDRVAHVHGDDDEQVRALLDESLQSSLVSALSRWPRLSVTDVDVQVRLKRPANRPEELEALVRGLVALAEAVESSRAKIAPTGEPASWLESWRRLGDDLGLAFDGALPTLSGSVDGREVQVAAGRGSSGYHARVVLWFAEHAATGLHLRPQVGPDGYWSVGQDIQVGHEGLDRALVIKAYDPDLLRSRLDGRACDTLLALVELGRVEVDDRRIVVDEISGADTAALSAAVGGARAFATSLGW